MEFDLTQGTAVLRRTPGVLRSLLEGLPDPWIRSNEGENTWSPYDILGHLIHGEETDWIPRARIILEHGDSRPFDRFDRFAQFQKPPGRRLENLLAEFVRLRQANLETLESWQLTPDHMQKRGLHPDLGPVTMGQLLATWVVHDLSHLAQISRVMCRQYTGQVGPWAEYLPILK
ncbi:MAG: DinB family protein [Bryobacteraceae bacterium]|nr:DinB family protein [Bryobacteraceae bacterium]